MRNKYDDIPNDSLSEIIDKWVKGERNRSIMKRRLIDGIKFEPLAEEFDLSVRHVKTIFYENEAVISKCVESDRTVPCTDSSRIVPRYYCETS